MAVIITKKTVTSIIAVLIGILLWFFGIIPMILVFALELGALLIGCISTAIGSIGLYMKKHVDEPREKKERALFGVVLLFGIAMLSIAGYTFFSAVTLFMSVSTFVGLFLILTAVFMCIKSKQYQYGFITGIIGLFVILWFGFNIEWSMSLFLILGLVMVGYALRKRRR